MPVAPTRSSNLQALAGIVAALALAAVAAAPAGADRGAYNNWHVHDGGSGVDANGLVHRGLAFFPAILTNGDVTAYQQDPAYCPDATDKLTLPAERMASSRSSAIASRTHSSSICAPFPPGTQCRPAIRARDRRPAGPSSTSR
jgi:hypothetical protein